MPVLQDIWCELPPAEDLCFSSLEAILADTEPLLSDDIWDKFDFQSIDLDHPFDAPSSIFSSSNSDVCEIRNHDCMWAGHCGSKEHPPDEPRPSLIAVPPVITAPKPPFKGGKQQQSLLKPALRNPVVVVTPQTPPMSDDEDSKTKITLRQTLKEVLSDNDLDLNEYLKEENLCEPPDVDDEEEEGEEEQEEEEEEEEQDEDCVRRYQMAAASDHSYHKGKTIVYGLDTPSESDEEIDVVSVAEKSNRILPTNPSSRDRHQLQRHINTAMSKKRIAPVSSSSSSISSNSIPSPSPYKTSSKRPETLKRRQPEPPSTRGPKRKQFRLGSPYKRRLACGNSSDSDHEPEPQEKRNLHNNMERQRRIDLRNAFEDLRVLVPGVNEKERAAKVVILREAAQYCRELDRTSAAYHRQAEEQRRRQEFLRRKLSHLRKNMALKRHID